MAASDAKPGGGASRGDLLDETRGYSFPEFDWMGRITPEYDAARRNLLAHVFTPENPDLPVKYREIIVAAILAVRHYPTIEHHLRRALREGATMKELIEAMQVAAIPGGSPSLHFALGHLARIAEEIEGNAGN